MLHILQAFSIIVAVKSVLTYLKSTYDVLILLVVVQAMRLRLGTIR